MNKQDDRRTLIVAATRLVCLAALALACLPAIAGPYGKIAYIKYARVGQYLLTDQKVFNPNNLETKMLTEHNSYLPEFAPRWSADGSRVVFTRAADYTAAIFIVNADGSGLTQISEYNQRDGLRRGSPCFSPDGERITYYAGGDIYIMNADGTGDGLLVENGYSPDCSPDGERIAFRRSTPGGDSLFSIGVDGTGLEQLTSDVYVYSAPRYSPDGTRILLQTVRFQPSFAFALEVMNADGSDRRELLSDPAKRVLATWSEDGSQIVYAVDPGRNQLQTLYRMGLDGGDPEPWMHLGYGRLQSFDIQPIQNVEIAVQPLVQNGLSGALAEVAILGSESMDADDLVAASLRAGPANAEPVHPLDDEFTRNEHLQDINLDGQLDLVMHVAVEDLGIECGDTLTLWGESVLGQIVAGSADVQAGGCGSWTPAIGTMR